MTILSLRFLKRIFLSCWVSELLLVVTFMIINKIDEDRPSYRWLLAGPARSGATFHKDPNYTSAWNAVITGVKKWILYPPHILPPGIGQSEDGLEVASPVSIVEWFTNEYEAPSDELKYTNHKRHKKTIAKPGKKARKRDDGIIECVLKAGEMIFVPSTWWHIVLNLEESIAVTQNFCNSFSIFILLKHVITLYCAFY